MKFAKVNIEISNICNLQCGFCPPVERTHGFMPVALFSQVIREVKPYTEQICFHLMGEPLLHPELEELIHLSEAHLIPVNLVTNGTLLNSVNSKVLLNSAIRQINFSVHSFLDNFPKANPEPYLASVFKFVDEALLQRPDLYINFRLWDLHSSIELSDAQKSIVEKISAKYNFHLEPPKSVKQRKSIRITGRLYAHFDTEFVWPSLEQPLIGEVGTCYGLTSHIGVLVDGTVVPCCLDKEGTLRLGSLKTHALSEILSGYRADRMKQNFKSGRLIEPLCQRCQYVTRFTAKTVERIAVAASGRPT